MARKIRFRRPEESGEFIWLMSLSDLMILLFLFFVMLFSFTYKKMEYAEFQEMVQALKPVKGNPTPLEQVQNSIDTFIKDQNLTEQISLEKTDGALVMEMRDKLFFESAKYEPTVNGRKVLNAVRVFLERVPEPYKIGIEGHTDDVPIHNKEVSDNWELSSRRALSVFYALNLPPGLLSRTVVMAYGDQKPVAPNRTPQGLALPENQAQNRRVTLRIF